MSVGLALIVQNEEIHIPATISQFYLIVDRIVVVDGGSSDATVDWARRMGAEVFHRPFRNNFSDQRNYALSLLDTDWVYFHDADERLEPTLIDLFPHFLTKEGQELLTKGKILPESSQAFDCFGFARKNFIDGKQIDIYPDYQYRLFRNYCRFEGAVDEKIVGYKNKTQVDFTRVGSPTVEDDQVYLDINSISRFNLLHYKSSLVKRQQDELYQRIREQEV
jgi:glycosyltransferase involved in cell wall biosynthesis